MRRRKNYDPMAESADPRWLKISDAMSNEISSRMIPPHADLREELRQEAARWASEGWTIEGEGGESRYGMFFMNRAGERHCVSIAISEHPVADHSSDTM